MTATSRRQTLRSDSAAAILRAMSRAVIRSEFFAAHRRAATIWFMAGTLLLCLWAWPAMAQQRSDDPPYEADLMRLSEILGALHYLRPLYGGADGTVWRDQMRALLDAEVQDGARERRFIERFNQGYRGFSSVYRRCTPAAEAALARYVEEGSALIRDVTTRYNR